jgi:Ni2+-binding GTPase involved in maturation of urease and hydrogenase
MDIPHYKFVNKEQLKSQHGPMFPQTIFCVIAGATGSGKTNLIVHLLTTPSLLDYSDVYIYAPTLYQDSYES